ncbi:MAG: YihY/virulence factor BrkB family protein, partial [Bacteroidia bacterium]|nr:YihY/virulence factor BrkB family protein [Bacteroidia bacterium]
MMHLTFVEIGKDRVMKLSAALSYYTVFSLPSLLIVIIGLSSRFFGKEAIEGKIYGQISGFVGTQAAMEIEGMLKNTTVNHDNLFITIVGIATLLFSATGIFGEIQDSINQIWGIEIKPGKGFVKLFLNRMLSFSMILILGFMGAVALLLSSVFNKLFSNLQAKYGEGWVNVLGLLDFLLIFSIISILFTCIFKVLPDARIKLKDALVGAMFTAMLFMLGKVLISYYLVNFAKISAFGAA